MKRKIVLIVALLAGADAGRRPTGRGDDLAAVVEGDADGLRVWLIQIFVKEVSLHPLRKKAKVTNIFVVFSLFQEQNLFIFI